MGAVPRSTPRVIDDVLGLDFVLSEAEPRPAEVRVVMADPDGFDVLYVINPHMAGNIGSVDTSTARQQWEAVQAAYRRCGYPVEVLDAVEGLPDLVFMANQSFPGQLPDGRWAAVMSFMHNVQRRREVPVVATWYEDRNALTFPLFDWKDLHFEGMGDAAWVPGRRVIVGGWGFRTERAAYDHLSAIFDVPVLAVELVDPRFYHADTCIQLIDDATAIYVPEAFTGEGRALLAAAFPRLLAVPVDEAVGGLACNGHSPDGRHFIVQKGNPRTAELVRGLGLTVIEVETGEFLKSGGSVYCMKLMLP
ncbi:MAG: N-dimethylarginine dimethylaminohydrolase [Myxococcota bacterium]|jgi:N-dimethylarginine dimethylaminohydrolase